MESTDYPADLVGRAENVEEIARLLRELTEGVSRVVDISGEPGIGKTRLLREIAELAWRRALPVLRTAGTGRPYGVAADVLEQLAARAGTPGGGLDSRTALTVAAVVADADDAPPAGPRSPRAVSAAIRVLVERVAAERGMVVLCDDGHRIDHASSEVFGQLVRHGVRVGLLFVAAHRPRQAPPELAQVLSSVPAVSMRLGPLSCEQLHRLVRLSLCGPHRRALHTASGGNPLYAGVLGNWCGGPARCDGRPFAALADGPAPRAAQPLRAELNQLEPDTTRLAFAAAVVGEPFDAALVARVSGVSETDALAGLDVLLSADMIRLSEQAGRFVFRHPVLRRVVHAAAPGGWRLGAHERALRVLRERGAPARRCVVHVERLAVENDLAAATGLAAGARELVLPAPDEAIGLYQAALRSLPEDPATVLRRADLLLAAAGCCLETGRVRQGRQLLDRWAQLGSGHAAPEHAALAAEHRAALLRLAGDHDEAEVVLREAVRLLPDVRDGRAVARLRLALAAGPEAPVEVADDALLAATGTGAVLLQAHALGLRGLAQVAAGATEGALRCVHEAGRLLDRLPDEMLAERLSALADLGRAELHLERHDAAGEHLLRAADVGARTGRWTVLVRSWVVLGWLRLRQGSRTEAEAYARRADATARSIDSAELLGETSALVAVVFGEGGLSGYAGYLPAWLATALRDTEGERTIDRLLDLCGGPALPRVPAYARVGLYDLLARRDEPAAARSWAARAQACAAALDLPGQRALAALVGRGADEEPEPSTPVTDGLTVLTPREYQVAELVSQGRTNRQIARTLELSHKTVETHLGRIFVKLGVSSRAEIANLVGRAEAHPGWGAGYESASCPRCGQTGQVAAAS